MIYPKPYATGNKLYPILGVSTTYSITEGDIQAALIADPKTAYYINEIAVIEDDPYAFSGVKNTISVLWETTFESTLLYNGYSYVLFPNETPEYPTFVSYANLGEVEWSRFALEPSTPTGGQLVWTIDNDFDFEGNSYTLYKIKGYGSNTQTVLKMDLHLTTLTPTN